MQIVGNERASNNMYYKKNYDKLPTGNYVEICGNCAFLIIICHVIVVQ